MRQWRISDNGARLVNVYKLEYLPSADLDIMEAEAYLHEYSPPAADKFMEAIEKQGGLLLDNPLMHKVYEDRPYFRCMLLPYEYLCFYHVDEDAKTITVHRILRGMRDMPNIL
jgi:plasmid stabilization system protein ParE